MDMALNGLLDAALQCVPVGTAHALWADTQIACGQGVSVMARLSAWCEDSRGIGKCEVLCALVRARIAQGLAAGDCLAHAHALASREWCEPERGWAAVGETLCTMGDLEGALRAWTHPESTYQFEHRAGVANLAVKLHRQGHWEGLAHLLAHVGAGHDQAMVLRQVLADVRRRAALGGALQVLWWIPECLRPSALLDGVAQAVADEDRDVGWSIEGMWDGLENEQASRARARAMLGDVDGARRLLSPMLVRWLGGSHSRHATDMRHGVVALGCLGDMDGACWCLERMSSQRNALRALTETADVCADLDPLMQSVLARWPNEIAVLRTVGLLEANLGRHATAWERLREAAQHASRLPDAYRRRLALQEVAHAQIHAGDVDTALHTITHLSHVRFGHEHRAAAAIRLAGAGDGMRSIALLEQLPKNNRLIRTICAIQRRSCTPVSVMMPMSLEGWTC